MTKDDIRKQLLTIRKNITNRDSLSQSINSKTIEYINNNFTNPKIASFISIHSEVDMSIINNHFETYLPIVHPYRKHSLWFAKDTKQYYKNTYKIKEPIFEIDDLTAAWDLDIVLVPLSGFNQDKYRMGMGGGFYDYSLQFKKSHKSPITIGIAFDEQQNNDIIIDEYDIKLDLIITPTRIL